MNDADASFEAHSTPAFTPHFDCFRSILSLDGIALVLYMLRAEFGCEEMACESSWVLVRRKGTDDGGIIELSLFFFLTLFFFRATSSSTSSPSSSFFLSLRPPPRPRRTTPPCRPPLPTRHHRHGARQRHPAHRRERGNSFAQGRRSGRVGGRFDRRDAAGEAAEVGSPRRSSGAGEAGEPAAQQLGQGPVSLLFGFYFLSFSFFFLSLSLKRR